MQTRARHEIVRLERGLVVLEVIVGIAPLLDFIVDHTPAPAGLHRSRRTRNLRSISCAMRASLPPFGGSISMRLRAPGNEPAREWSTGRAMSQLVAKQ